MPRIVPHDAILIPEHAERVFKGVIYDVFQWQQELYDGSTATFERLRRPDTVLVVCIKDDNIVFTREEQPGRSPYTSLPGGRVEPGEDWDLAVQRECHEELGLQFKQWRLIDAVQPVTKIEWFVATYVAFDLIAEDTPHHDAGEKIEMITMSFDEAKAFVAGDSDPLNVRLKESFASLNSIKDLMQLPQFEGKIL